MKLILVFICTLFILNFSAKAADLKYTLKMSYSESYAGNEGFERIMQKQGIKISAEDFKKLPSDIQTKMLKQVEGVVIEPISHEETLYDLNKELKKSDLTLHLKKLEIDCAVNNPKAPQISCRDKASSVAMIREIGDDCQELLTHQTEANLVIAYYSKEIDNRHYGYFLTVQCSR